MKSVLFKSMIIAGVCSGHALANDGQAEQFSDVPSAVTGAAKLKLRNGATVDVNYVDYGGHAVVEGDMIIGSTLSMDDNYLGQGVGHTSIGRLWREGVLAYRIDSSLTSQSRNNLNAAIAHWRQRTGIRFVEVDAHNMMYYPDYVLVEDSGGCAAHVGRQGGTQKLYLSSNCSVGNAIHELGHALGLFHEHTRTDRDDFVRVNFANVQSGYSGNFEKTWYSGVSNIGGYDYGSIMHYGMNAFSNNGGATIVPHDASKSSQMGQRSGLSQGDIASVQSMYATDLAVSIEQVDTADGRAKASVTLSNIDDFGANDLRLTLSSPEDITSVQGAGWTCEKSAQVECSLSSLAANANTALTVFVSSNGTTAQLSAHLSAASMDLNHQNNAAYASLTIAQSAGNRPPVLEEIGTIQIPQNPQGGTIVQKLSASDAELGSVQYKLVGGNATRALTLDPSTGAISIYDAEAAKSLSGSDNYLDVSLSDGLAESEPYRVYVAAFDSSSVPETSAASTTNSTSASNTGESSGGSGASGGGAVSLFVLLMVSALGVVALRRSK